MMHIQGVKMFYFDSSSSLCFAGSSFRHVSYGVSFLLDATLQHLTVNHIHQQEYGQAGANYPCHDHTNRMIGVCEVWLGAMFIVPCTDKVAEEFVANFSGGIVVMY